VLKGYLWLWVLRVGLPSFKRRERERERKGAGVVGAGEVMGEEGEWAYVRDMRVDSLDQQTALQPFVPLPLYLPQNHSIQQKPTHHPSA
jgi:hypothetical protein